MSYNRDKNKGIVQFQMVEIRCGMMCVFIYFSFLSLTSLPSPAENQASSPLLGLHSGLPPVRHGTLLLLLLLSRFSHVRLCATPETAAHQAPLSLGFSRQEHWSGLPFPSPVRESEVAQSYSTLSDLMDCSLPGSSVHGIFQARVLEWVATAYSNGQNNAPQRCLCPNPQNLGLSYLTW